MPVKCTFDEANNIIGIDFRDAVTVHEFIEAMRAISSNNKSTVEVDHLCRFHENTDLSSLKLEDFEHINNFIKDFYSDIKFVRRKDACVLDGSMDAKIVAPLWRAVCSIDNDVDVDVKFFSNNEEAAEWLQINLDIIEQVLPKDRD